jgi:ABC-type thiamin/hydroxymethylpyrimidine transport system permease subunit
MFIKMWQPQSNPHSNISYYCNELLTQFSLQTLINGGVQCKFVVFVFKQRSVSWDSDVQVGLSIPLRSIAKPS